LVVGNSWRLLWLGVRAGGGEQEAAAWRRPLEISGALEPDHTGTRVCTHRLSGVGKCDQPAAAAAASASASAGAGAAAFGPAGVAVSVSAAPDPAAVAATVVAAAAEARRSELDT
jgi:hypothetical protein